VSPSNSSAAVKVEKSDVEEASSAELDDIIPRNSGSKKTGEEEQWEIPDPIPYVVMLQQLHIISQ
jgi:hypothetical protein